MIESHLAVASSLEEIPQTQKGNPIPSQFPYGSMHDPAVTEYTYTVPLGEFGVGDAPYIAAHAEVQRVKRNGKVKKEESAWVTGEEGQVFKGNKWATYFCYTDRIWEGDFEIWNVGDLAGYTRVTGNLFIFMHATEETNLEWLSCLTSVGGKLSISGSYIMENLAGLESLICVGGDLYIGGRYVQSLIGLNNLITVGGDLIIDEQRSLKDLTGLENLAFIGGSLRVHQSFFDFDFTFTGLESLSSIAGDLWIDDTDGLVNMTGLEKLTSIGGNVQISVNRALQSLTGLDNLTSVGGNVVFDYNHILPDFNGIDNLTSVGGNFEIRFHPALTSLTGINAQISVGGDLVISGNTALPTLLAEEFAQQLVENGFTGNITIECNLP